jgi:hypothetical protein
MIASGNGVGEGVGVGTGDGVTVGVGVGEGVTEGGGLNFGPGHPASRVQLTNNAVNAGNGKLRKWSKGDNLLSSGTTSFLPEKTS